MSINFIVIFKELAFDFVIFPYCFPAFNFIDFYVLVFPSSVSFGFIFLLFF